jgi:hypothetical protein
MFPAMQEIAHALTADANLARKCALHAALLLSLSATPIHVKHLTKPGD